MYCWCCYASCTIRGKDVRMHRFVIDRQVWCNEIISVCDICSCCGCSELLSQRYTSKELSWHFLISLKLNIAAWGIAAWFWELCYSILWTSTMTGRISLKTTKTGRSLELWLIFLVWYYKPHKPDEQTDVAQCLEIISNKTEFIQ